ncbi:acyl-CoA dehydrogenase family protein [Natrinema sp. 1APR25-10V2]|uniref:acyl-CoA dehydrogenase family protein n=1 Tax=Natrinema sp. 1APR25-10V2 TaxID=2951081 RepID=UPI002876EF1A|nr:acyl-CoA dehydrogenase family protein [Natrinema sp. 1APR25-10V2]MDS0477011.1 acyl-CoA dehydrogenase family protein [Natrinema sp. 1APR25-10V2]
MEYQDSERARELAQRARAFVDEEVIPRERELEGGTKVPDDVISDLREEARERGLYAPQIDEEHGGMGVEFRDVLPLFEEAGRSLLAPPAMRVDAPDEGNMHTLELAGTEDQQKRWLEPLLRGELTSAFSMTEPRQGGGADPKMIKTTAKRDGDEWVINGHKWWITNGGEADFFITLARTDQESHPYEGCSLIVVPGDTPGLEVKRDIPHMGDDITSMVHSEMLYEDVRVPAENLLGEEGEGFTIAQKRLGPARLTHCMRYSGMAARALEVAKAYTSDREGFGGPIADKQDIRFDIAEAETNLHAARTMVRHAADQISRGDQARVPVSMCKFFTANVTEDAINTALQLCGASGIGKDLPIADFYENVRQFRIVDGPDEVHKRVIARDAYEDVDMDELDPLPTF